MVMAIMVMLKFMFFIVDFIQGLNPANAIAEIKKMLARS